MRRERDLNSPHEMNLVERKRERRRKLLKTLVQVSQVQQSFASTEHRVHHRVVIPGFGSLPSTQSGGERQSDDSNYKNPMLKDPYGKRPFGKCPAELAQATKLASAERNLRSRYHPGF